MALGKSSAGMSKTTYVQLARGEDSGFKQSVAALDSAGQPSKVVNTFDHVTGVPVAFYMKQELIYEASKDLRAKGINPQTADLAKFDEDQKKFVATLMMRDPDTGEMVGVNFDLHDGMGGKIVGMLVAAKHADALSKDFQLRTFYAPAKSKYNDSDKGRSSINLRPNGSKLPADDIKPMYIIAGGGPLLDKEGQLSHQLPMGTVAGRAKGKDVWEFSARNEIISETALVLVDHFAKPGDTNNHEEGGVDLNEAAAAAAPHG